MRRAKAFIFAAEEDFTHMTDIKNTSGASYS
jgi:hypothetical protein